MLRSKEVQRFIIVLTVIAALGASISAFFSLEAAAVTLAASLCLIGSFLFFTKRRYRKIEQLSEFLRQVSNGDFNLDVRDNEEGELSILKSEIFKVTQRLSEQHSDLKKDKLQLSEALSDISHQLKTPLTSMMMMADLLSSASLPAEKRTEFTHSISQQLERIEWLVSSLLKLSKIDAGTARFNKETVSLPLLVKKAAEPIVIPLDINEQTLTISGDPDTSFTGDFKWTAEALINILKNCMEHTPSGGKIAVTFSENTLFTEITIQDNGKGIPKEDLPYVFKRFYKGRNAGEDSIGIGLSMAHSIITSQNGTLDVQSEPDSGTLFTIKFYKHTV